MAILCVGLTRETTPVVFPLSFQVAPAVHRWAVEALMYLTIGLRVNRLCACACACVCVGVCVGGGVRARARARARVLVCVCARACVCVRVCV